MRKLRFQMKRTSCVLWPVVPRVCSLKGREHTSHLVDYHLPHAFDWALTKELPVSLGALLLLQLQLGLSSVFSAPPWPHLLTLTCNLLSGHMFLYQALGRGLPLSSLPGSLYLPFPSNLQELHCFLDLNCSVPGSKLEPVTLPEERDSWLPPPPSMVRIPPTAFCLSPSMPKANLFPSNFSPAPFPEFSQWVWWFRVSPWSFIYARILKNEGKRLRSTYQYVIIKTLV